jgi:hypothetical protein
MVNREMLVKERKKREPHSCEHGPNSGVVLTAMRFISEQQSNLFKLTSVSELLSDVLCKGVMQDGFQIFEQIYLKVTRESKES